MKNYIIFILVIMITAGCCDCLDPAEDPEQLLCSVRETTITEFDARVTEIEGQFDDDPELDTIYEPVDSYNIHAFRFGTKSTTGTLENDERFSSDEGIDLIAVERYPIPNTTLEFAIFDNAPANEDINGDILVEDVQLQNPGTDFALIRVSGYIGFYAQDFWSESSTRFCEYIRANNDDLIEKFVSNDGDRQYSRYGQELNPPRLVTSNGTNDFGIIDRNGNLVIEDIDNLAENLDGLEPDDYRGLANLVNREEQEIYSIRVEVGDVFFYMSRAGRQYLMAIINIDERDIEGLQEPAVKKRLSIIFSEL